MSLRLSILEEPEADAPAEEHAHVLAESTERRPMVEGWYSPPQGEITVRDLARYRFADGSASVTAERCPEAPVEAVTHSFYTTALPLIAWACERLEAFHASAVCVPGGVLALCGPSEAGKSTLAHALDARGYERFAEDAVVFSAGDGVRAVPLPFTTRLRRASSDHFTSAGAEEPGPQEVRRARVSEQPFVAVLLLAPGAEGWARLEPLGASEALLELLPNGHRFRGQPAARKREMMAAYLALVAETPVYRLTYPHRFDRLDGVLDAIEAALPA